LNRALKELQQERARLDRQIAAISTAVSEVGGKVARAVGAKSTRRRTARSMSAAQKKAVSVRMKAYWAKRRSAK
jgi:predicted metalloprotease